MIDGLYLGALSIVVLVVSEFGGLFGQAIAMSLIFVIWNGYFIWFEGRKQGYTPGKRKIGIRVIDRHGGALTPEAVLARNLTRNVEMILPLSVLFASGQSTGGLGLASLLSGGWILLFLLLPLFNRDRMRVGDFIAGTLVIRAPREPLLADVGERVVRSAEGRERATFTLDQLDVYGIYELQVLEQLLRSEKPRRREAMRTVADQIKKKIGWTSSGEDIDVLRFLQDFYAAQRAHLEQRMLLGERREMKRGREDGDSTDPSKKK